jgi:hypothetical protein
MKTWKTHRNGQPTYYFRAGPAVRFRGEGSKAVIVVSIASQSRL